MAKITKTFTYDIADDYLYETNDLGKTAEWTYSGPDKIWIFIDKETNLINCHFKTKEEDGDIYPTPLDQYKLMVDCETDPLLCCLVGADDPTDHQALPQYEEELPDGTVYRRPLNPVPDHTYEATEIQYNPTTEQLVKPYPWKKPHITWELFRKGRNAELAMSDDRVVSDIPESLRTAWEEFRQKLRDIPQVHGAAHSGETPTTDPWKLQQYPKPDGTQ
jgi:hypothetical protein